jgi:uncharacterized membrane protein
MMQDKKEKVFSYVSNILMIGSYSAAVVLILGLGLLFLHGQPGGYLTKLPRLTFSALISHFFKGEPTSIISCGILVMMFTPFLRVVVAGFSFLWEKDYKYALISLAITLILLFTIIPTFF